jgi:trehalose 6-phosphate phosphatase
MAVALHVRGATPDAAVEALRRARDALAGDQRVTVHEGHQVVEAAVRAVSKAGAVAELRDVLAPASVAFFGDDRADEGVFAGMGAADVSVKVGTGPTAARWRVAAPIDVVDILTRLATTTH